MLRALVVNVIFLLFVANSYALQNSDSVYVNEVHIIEDYILKNNNDSALVLIAKQKPDSYLSSLNRISTGRANYTDYQNYLARLENRNDIYYQDVSAFIDKIIKQPANTKVIDLDYVNIIWNQVSKLRDDVSIEEASRVQVKLENYINLFNPLDTDVQKAKILASTHQIVLYIIQREIDKGKKLCLDNFQLSEKLNDKRLMIVSLYYLCEFIIFEGKLDEYINTCEQSLQLESTLNTKSSYYAGTLIHIIDAYIYKGGNEERVQHLLTELYNYPNAQAQSYSLYAKYLGALRLNSTEAKNIFEQFDVENLIEFCHKTEKLGEDALNSNDFYQLLREISNTLEIHGYLKEAIAIKDRTVVLIKKIYSQDLANSLASYKTRQAVKEKDLKIKHQNERTNLYIIIASLIAVLLVVSVFAWLRKRRQSKVLELKNKQISKALKDKELLVKEVHHRVKNNFQIVSSLLELQSRGIEDKKARMLANEGQNRVKSMALIHQKLYQNEDGLIDFDEYVHLLVKELSSLYSSGIKVDTIVSAEHMRFDVDTAIPLGLIINELITNAYKYAFTKEKEGRLEVSIVRVDADNYKLVVWDSGSGLPAGFDLKKANTLGIRLVTRLVKQLQGSIIVTNNKGAKFEIIFKDIHARKNIN